MDIRHLKLVKTVSEEGSLTNAARILHLSQSALSHQLRDLEEELNISVFHRVNKKLVLTTAGKILLESSRKILDEISRTRHEIDKLTEGETGSICISTECYTCYHWLPPIIKEFNKSYPNVDVKIKTDTGHTTVENLLNGTLDMALVHHEVEDPNISYENVFEDELVIIFSPEHPFAKKNVVMPKDFTDQTLITHSRDFESSTLNQKVLNRYNITPASVIYVQLTGAAVEMVKANLGITVLPRWIVGNYIKKGELKELPLTQKKLYRSWKIALIKDPYIPSYLTCFNELLVSRAQEVFAQ